MIAGLSLFLIILILIFIGIPIAFSMGIAAVIGLFLIPGIPLQVVPQSIYAGINYFPLLAIPFFILAGEIMNQCGLTRKLVKLASLIIGRAPASLAQVNILTSMFFGGITGSAAADTSSIGSILIPAMIEEGYSKEFSVAVTAASSTCGPIIPPSIIMVIYGATVGVSIGGLFASGIIAGIMIGVSEMILVVILNKKKKFPRRIEKYARNEVYKILKEGIWPLGMPIIVMGGILGGIFTPTEAGAAAVVYALLIGFIFKTITIKDLAPMLQHAAKVSASVLLIVSVAKILGWVFSVLQMSSKIGLFFSTLPGGAIIFLIAANILLFLMGMFMDAGASVILLAPILAPIASRLGLNPLHFGLIVVLNLIIGLGTPPVGVCLFIACGIAKLPLEKGSRAIMPFILVEVIVLLIVTYIPDLILFIPRLMGYS